MFVVNLKINQVSNNLKLPYSFEVVDTYNFRQSVKNTKINCLKITDQSPDLQTIKVMVGYENKKVKEIEMKSKAQ